MTSIGILQILVFFGLILLVTKPVGLFMSRLFQGERTFLHPVFRPIEVLVYKLCGVREDQEQRWTQYTASLLAFSLFAFLFPYALMRLQGLLPLNPQGFGASQVSPDQSFNTAISFMTNTNWQWYSGESTMSYLVQMAALAVQNFVSAAAGHRGRDCVDSRLRPSRDRQDRELLGRSDPRHAVRPDSDLDRRRARAVLAGRHPELPSLHGRQDGRRRDADDRAGSGRLAGGDQAARHERRRLLQRQLVAPLREPERVHEPRADLPDLHPRRRPHLHVRPHGQGHAARAGRSSGRWR